jgi:hypothetical protein
MTHQEQAWLEFVKQAKDIYPPFADEKVIKAVLKSRGETTFKPEYTNKFINVLKSMVTVGRLFSRMPKKLIMNLVTTKL